MKGTTAPIGAAALASVKDFARCPWGTRPAGTSRPGANDFPRDTCGFYPPRAHLTPLHWVLARSLHVCTVRSGPDRRAAASAPHRPRADTARPTHPLAGPAPLSPAAPRKPAAHPPPGTLRGPCRRAQRRRPLPPPAQPRAGWRAAGRTARDRPSGRRVPAEAPGASARPGPPADGAGVAAAAPTRSEVCPRRVPRGQARSSAATPWAPRRRPAGREGGRRREETGRDGTGGEGRGGQPSARPPSAGHYCPARGAREEEARSRPPGPQPASNPMARQRRAHGGAGRAGGGRRRATIGRGAGTAPWRPPAPAPRARRCRRARPGPRAPPARTWAHTRTHTPTPPAGGGGGGRGAWRSGRPRTEAGRAPRGSKPPQPRMGARGHNGGSAGERHPPRPSLATALNALRGDARSAVGVSRPPIPFGRVRDAGRSP